MRSSCPITGDVADIVESVGRVVVEHPKLGRYVLDANAVPALAADAAARTRIARWIDESHSLGIDIPDLTVEHVHFFERLADLEAGISEWHERRQDIKQVDEERLWKKLRLEWNYNSNHIEGNTLTYHETELLLIYDRTAGGHPLRDYEEMKAHNVAIDHARQLASAEQILGEGDIRDLNKILLKEPFWQSAETPDSQPTRKRIVPGQYKTQPNHVRTATGELHRFAEPEETPALAEEWTRDFRRDLQRSLPVEVSAQAGVYPLPLFLAESHWRFIDIHPFDDGNGRTARLLTNYVLLRINLPPIVIRGDDRDRYISGLQNADLGRMLPLAQFMLENVLWSLQLGIRAVKGESIQEPYDMEKEIAVFVRGKRGRAPADSDVEALEKVVLMHVRPTLDKLQSGLDNLSQLFRTYSNTSYLAIGGSRVSMNRLFEPRNWESIKQDRIVKPGFYLDDERQVELGKESRFHSYTGSGNRDFNLMVSVVWKLGRERFSLMAAVDGKRLQDIGSSTLYSELDVHDAEVERTVDKICKAMMDEIDNRAQVPKEER